MNPLVRPSWREATRKLTNRTIAIVRMVGYVFWPVLAIYILYLLLSRLGWNSFFNSDPSAYN